MTTTEPGDRPAEPGERAATVDRPVAESRRLAQPPSARYAASSEAGASDGPSSLTGPLARAITAALLGAAALVLVGAVLASTFGLLLVGGAVGAMIGLLLARAAVPDGSKPARPTPRATVVRFAVGLAIATVVVADVGTWLYALREGGTLGLLDYLWTTFGPFVPGVALVAAVTAAWGASAGPVQR